MKSFSLLTCISIIILLFLYVPLMLVIGFSFNDSQLNAKWVGWTTKWYVVFWHDDAMQEAMKNSLFVATVSCFLSTVLGTLAGLGLHQSNQKYQNFKNHQTQSNQISWFKGQFFEKSVFKYQSFVTFTPIAMPEILLGVSLLLLFRQGLNWQLGMMSVIIAHTTFCIGFVAIMIRSRLIDIDSSLFEAAQDLGANSWQRFMYVLFPLIRPNMIAGALMAFTLSIDDFVITFFTTGVGVKMLPLEIYSMIKVALTPEVNVVSTLLMALTLFLILCGFKITQTTEK
jgi:spermidine/putrescine transport system permease protein